ncbi:hypothetical protein SLS58_010510 [Diplodia intermedia]|uniref:N-acetyltransferase domain-containing protein n=1 Tax=Diplodia intermedia TaxID=856260 RepID=A0ABR3T5T0_9PEZI
MFSKSMRSTVADLIRDLKPMHTNKNDIIESNQIGSCIGQIFNREHALNNCFSISSQNAGFQTRTFLQCVYDEQVSLPTSQALTSRLTNPSHSTGNLFPTLVEPAQNPFNDADPDPDPDDILQRDATTSSALSNRHLVGEHSFVFIEGVRVQTSHRRRGVGRALLKALLAEAAAILPSIRFAASWPCASDGDPDDLADVVHFRSANDGAGCSPRRSGLGQKRAEAFHRAAGFRRLGLTRFWAKSLE